MSDNEKQVKMGVIPMFATPLFVFPIDNWNKYRKTILNLLPKIEAVNGISTDRSAFGEEKVLPHYAGVVFDIVEKQLEEFSKSVMDSKGAKDYTETALGITEMWYRTDTSEAQYTIDNEGTVGWTAILHIDYDREIHRPPFFLSPAPKPGSGDIDSFEYPVEEGMLIIFPSTTAYQPGAINPEEDVKRTLVTFNIKTDPVKSLKTITYEIENA